MKISDAILRIRPKAQFVIYGEDYSTIVWHKLEGEVPTEAEIKKAINEIEAEKLKLAAEAKTAKEIAQAKMAALGLTTDDLKALGL
jgi:hypothetical protein